jgi:CHAT domain-containing protein/Tfp pilus assembly protein PilF
MNILKNVFQKAFITIIILSHPLFSQSATHLSTDLQKKYAICLKLMGEERYEQAINEFKILLANYPEFHLPYRNLVESYIFLGDIDTARYFFQNLKDKDSLNPNIFYALSRLDFQQGEYEKSLHNLKQCISLDPTYPDAYGPFGGLAEIYKANGNLENGEIFLTDLIEKSPENPYSYYGLGRIYMKKYEWGNALEMFNKSIALDSNQVLSYHSMRFVYQILGDYNNSLKMSRTLLNRARYMNDLEMVAYALLKIGDIYFLTGDLNKSLSYLNQSLKISYNIGSKKREGIALNTMGAVFATLGNHKKALKYFQLSLNLVRKTGVVRTEIRTLYNIGLIHKDLKNYQEAFNFFDQALQIAKKRKYKIESSMIQTGIAETYSDLKNFTNALHNFNEALNIAIEVGNEAEQAYILKNIGDVYHQIGNFENAIKYHNKALELSELIRDVQIVWEARAGLGANYHKMGDFEKAIYYYSNATAIYDSIRQNLDIQSLVGGLLDDKYEVYPSIIQLLGDQQKIDEAYKFTEKYKANTLLKILSRGNFLLTELLPDSLRLTLIEVRDHLANLHTSFSKELAKPEQNNQRLLELEQQITEYEIKIATIRNSVKRNFKEFYKLTVYEPLSIYEVQNEILKPGQLLIEFVVGSQSTSVFVVGNDTAIYKKLLITRNELKQLLVGLSSIYNFLSQHTGNGRDIIINPDQADFSIPPAFTLYKTILGDFESLLRESSEIIIIPDDFLYYLPFEILVTDTSAVGTRYDFENANFLIQDIIISYSPSASLLNPLLTRSRNPSKGILAIGNPKYGRGEETLFDSTTVDFKLLEIGNISGWKENFFQLPSTKTEVNNIIKIFPGSSSRVYVGESASELSFKENAKNYQIIHLASHFIVNDQEPLYSKVVLTKTDKSKEDGFLQTYEIFDMELNAELVVLSACNTALGKLNKGEGIVGMTRAFRYAGVPSMVVSLWNVDDEATSLLMQNFYKYLKEGLKKDEALRLAKLEYLKKADLRKKDPYYWAPFILIGDVNPIYFSKEINYFRIFLFSGLLITLTIMLLFTIKKQYWSKTIKKV